MDASSKLLQGIEDVISSFESKAKSLRKKQRDFSDLPQESSRLADKASTYEQEARNLRSLFGNALDESSAQQESPQTIRVKIAIAINEHGHWNAMGFYRWPEKEAKQTALEGLDDPSLCEMVHCIEADVPIPQMLVIEGEAGSGEAAS